MRSPETIKYNIDRQNQIKENKIKQKEADNKDNIYTAIALLSLAIDIKAQQRKKKWWKLGA